METKFFDNNGNEIHSTTPREKVLKEFHKQKIADDYNKRVAELYKQYTTPVKPEPQVEEFQLRPAIINWTIEIFITLKELYQIALWLIKIPFEIKAGRKLK